MTTTGFLSDERYFWHDTGSGYIIPADGRLVQPFQHPENADTKRRFKSLLEVTGLLAHLQPLKPRPATAEEVLRVHTADYFERMMALNPTGGDAGGLTPFGPGSVEIALLSAGGVIAAVDAVMQDQVQNVYALVRPPGHHAIADSGMGFCIFNNNGIAIRHLQTHYGLKRIALVDWDVHHGNGAQAIFYNESEVLTISSHQNLCFPPESGYIHQNGEGAGEGYNINIPLPPGSGHGAYVAAYERVVVPALRRYRPEFIIVASGLDANIFDPLARMMAWSETFRQMTRLIKTTAAELCGGKLVIAHEGGYSAAYVPYCGLAVVEELCGVRSGAEDAYAFIAAGTGEQDLQPHQDAVIRQVEALLEKIK
jgi:acetoin utilization deacetylase AcuC-like enzyme